MEKYRIVEIPTPLMTDEIERQLIGMRTNSFGVMGLTEDSAIWNLEGVSAKLPVVEDLAIYIRELSIGGDDYADILETK
jgi:hypothetical protein